MEYLQKYLIMIKKFLIKILWFFGRHTRIHLINRALTELNYNNILNSKKYSDDKNLINFGFKVYSQADEDGIIEEIFNRIGVSNKKFIEFGVQDGTECNTTYLLKSGWSGIWVDMSTNENKLKLEFKNYLNEKLKFIKKKLTKNNVNEILNNNISNDEEIDLLSIDIGVNNYHILSEININPRVIVTEYNAKLRDKIEWIADYNEDKIWSGDDYFGASINSYKIMLEKKGYLLVGCNITGVNAFFVKKDLIDTKFINNYSSSFHYEPLRIWLLKKFENEQKIKI
tara:strand:+ start:135 stop:986 length:852 start_codon:yes stop_codon:yes gene_type:complete